MVKKIKQCIFATVFAVSVFMAKQSYAILPSPAWPIPTLDFANDAIHGIEKLEVIKKVKRIAELRTLVSSLSELKTLGLSYKDKLCFIGCSGNQKGKPVTALSNIKSDINAVAINAGLKKNLLVKKEGFSNSHCQKQLNRKIHENSVKVMYNVASVSQANLESKRMRLEEYRKGAIDGAKTADADMDEADNQGTYLENLFKMVSLLDEVTKEIEDLYAVRAQFIAAEVMKDEVEPINVKELDRLKERSSEVDTSSVNIGNLVFANSQVKISSGYTMASAQASGGAKDEYDFLGMKPAQKYDSTNPFDGQEDNLEALKLTADLAEKVNTALELHNVSASLKSYRGLFLEYEKTVKLHNHSLKNLKISDQCSADYIGKYYNNKENVWYGGEMLASVNNHSARKGVSKRLIDLYDVAKAEMVIADSEGLFNTPAVEIGSPTTMSNKVAGASDRNNEKANPIREQEVKAIGRANMYLKWNIGYEVSKALGLDQQITHNWGGESEHFDLWSDSKNFYWQYIDAKYNNIIELLKVIDLRPAEVETAREFNKLNNVNVAKLAEENASSKNPKWISDLKGFQMTVPLGPIEDAIELEVSKWVAPVKQKQEGISLNKIKLDEREVILKKERAKLVKEKEDLNKRLTMVGANVVAIKKRISEIDARIVDIDAELQDIANNRVWLNGYNGELTGIVKTEDFTVMTNTELEVAQEQEKEVFDKLYGEFNETIKVFEDSISNIVKERDLELIVYNNELSVLSSKIDEALELAGLYNEGVKKVDEADLAVREKIDPDAKAEAIDKADYKKRAKDKKSLADKLTNDAIKIMEKIDERTKYHDKRIALVEREFTLKREELYSRAPKFDFMSPLSYLYNNKVLQNIPSADKVYSSALAGYLGHAVEISEGFRPYTVKIAEDTKKSIVGLKEKLYEQSRSDDVNEKHVAMINKLKNISVEDVLEYSASLRGKYAPYVAILEIMSDAYNRYVVEKACPESACYTKDDVYFVGLVAKNRDLQAPKEPIKEYLPPLREAFLFDEVDYKALFSDNNYVRVVENPGIKVGNKVVGATYKKIHYASKYSIANRNAQTPSVWKLALSGRAFVERDINLEDFLSNGPSDANLYRAGVYPCTINNAVFDISGSAWFLAYGRGFDVLPECREIDVKGGPIYYSVKNKFSGETASITAVKKPSILGDEVIDYEKERHFGPSSELGQMFYFYDGHLAYRESFKEAFNRMLEVVRYQEKGEEYKSSIKDDIYSSSIFNKNQFEDFLAFVERERMHHDAKEKMRLSVEEAKADLFEVLRKVGYEPNPNMNLANDNEYKELKVVLRNKKLNAMNKIKTEMKELEENPAAALASVKERLAVSESNYRALEIDSEETISLPSMGSDPAKVSEDVKSEKANLKVLEEKEKDSNKAIEEELRKMGVVYCASY